jgi:hypothetical protein
MQTSFAACMKTIERLEEKLIGTRPSGQIKLKPTRSYMQPCQILEAQLRSSEPLFEDLHQRLNLGELYKVFLCFLVHHIVFSHYR